VRVRVRAFASVCVFGFVRVAPQIFRGLFKGLPKLTASPVPTPPNLLKVCENLW